MLEGVAELALKQLAPKRPLLAAMRAGAAAKLPVIL